MIPCFYLNVEGVEIRVEYHRLSWWGRLRRHTNYVIICHGCERRFPLHTTLDVARDIAFEHFHLYHERIP